jgi:hypothetical protein
MAPPQITSKFPNPAVDSPGSAILPHEAWSNKTACGMVRRPFSKLLDPADAPTEYHLYQALTDAAKETEVDWPDSFDWKQTKSRITEIALGSLLFATLAGFAVACWEGLGYVYAVIFSLTVYLR